MHTNVTETKIKVSDIVESCICPFVHIRQLKPNSREKIVIDESDFVNTDKTFADIFPNMVKHKLYYIDDEAYKISKIEDNV